MELNAAATAEVAVGNAVRVVMGKSPQDAEVRDGELLFD